MDIQGDWLSSIAARGGPVVLGPRGDIVVVRSLAIPLAHSRLGSSYLYLSLILALLRSQHDEAELRCYRSFR